MCISNITSTGRILRPAFQKWQTYFLFEIAYMYYDYVKPFGPCINHHLIVYMYSSLWSELHSPLFPLSSTLFTCLSELGSISNHGGQGELVTTTAIGKGKKRREVFVVGSVARSCR